MFANARLWLVYLGGFLAAVHFASVSYLNSSLLKQFVGDSALNILYISGSIFCIIILFLAPLAVRRYGSIAVFLSLVAVEIIVVFGLGVAEAAFLIFPLFLIHIAADPALYFCLDLNLEQETRTEGATGRVRGIFLTISNLAWVLSPLAIALLAADDDFGRVYIFSSLILIPLFTLIALFFKNTKKAKVTDSNIFASLVALKRGGDKTRSLVLQFILNFFYSWMVIYLPLLLRREIGFEWGEIGLIFTIMLLPFLLFELPAGILSDKKLGEKELLTGGFIVMSLATLVIPSLATPVFWTWALALFATRIGASIVEVSNESYFFKHVKEEDTGLISLFRVARPLSFVIAPLVALPVVHFFSYSESFYFLAFFAALGLFFIPKVDTR